MTKTQLRTIETVLFDLDGTIIDTNELIITSFLQSLEGELAEPLTREYIAMHMGKPLAEQFQLFTGRVDVEELVRKYRKINVGLHDRMVREFPHAREVLARLRAEGIRVGVVTSKARQTTAMGLALCGLDAFPQTIVTIDDVAKAKPDPEGIHKALQQLGAAPETAMMVGDSHYDLQAAKNAGIRSAAVSWSLKGEAYLQQFAPDYMLRDLRDLLDIVGAAGDAH